MLDDYVEFFMDPNTAECYCKLKEELDKLLQKKVGPYCALFLFLLCMFIFGEEGGREFFFSFLLLKLYYMLLSLDNHKCF